jgi:hypothetical protein
MNRLRVRVELNRRKSGVPLEELVSVVEETRKFFQLLAQDVEIPVDRGEWRASNFDPESLNFTAEYSGPASAEQIRAFGLAFADGDTRQGARPLRNLLTLRISSAKMSWRVWVVPVRSGERADWRCLPGEILCG